MNSKEKVAQRWDEWLPPSPHREAITDLVVRGRVSIVQPDPEEPPLLLCEDGGCMQLSLVRYDGDSPIYSAGRPRLDADHRRRSTKYSDVCGTLDEFKGIVEDGTDALADNREHIDELLDDIRYMIGRMYRRQREYTRFADRIRSVLQQLEAVAVVDRSSADEALDEIERLLYADPSAKQERLNELAEQVRDVANAQEDRLREHKQAALELLGAYRDIKGPRDWRQDEQSHNDED